MVDLSPLTDRDKEILVAVHRNRYLSFAHIHRVFFPGGHHAPVSRRLKRLVELGYLKEFRKLVDQGGRPKYFFLSRTPGGHAVRRLITDERMRFFQTIGSPISAEKADPGELTIAQLQPGRNPPDIEHTSEVSDLWSYFHLATEARPELEMAFWETERHRHRTIKEVQSGVPNHDYRLVLREKEKTWLFFGEHDRCHEPKRRFELRKVEAYLDLYLSGKSHALYGASSFKVLITIAHAEEKVALQRMRDLTQIAVRTAGDHADLFLFTFFGPLDERRILSPVWMGPPLAPDQDGRMRTRLSIFEG